MWIRWFFETLFSRSLYTVEADFCIVGIGNPGVRYSGTRHNVGFMVVDELASGLQKRRIMRLCTTEAVAGVTTEGCRILAAKPQTFVNRSGEAVGALLKSLGLAPAACLIVVDDFHLPLGTMRLRRAGSDGGHNGLKSIVEKIGTGFPRLRIGIGPVPSGVATVDFVLSRFSEAEEKLVRDIIPKASEAARIFCSKGIDAAMNIYNS